MTPKPEHYEKYKYLIYRLIAQYKFPPDYVPDALSAGYLGISRALKTYKKGKSSVCTWCFIHIRKEIQKLKNGIFFTTASPKTRQTANEELCTIDFIDQVAVSKDDVMVNVCNNEKQDILLEFTNKLNMKFNSLDCRMFTDYYYAGLTKQEMSKKYKIDQLNLHNKLNGMLEVVKSII